MLELRRGGGVLLFDEGQLVLEQEHVFLLLLPQAVLLGVPRRPALIRDHEIPDPAIQGFDLMVLALNVQIACDGGADAADRDDAYHGRQFGLDRRDEI